ncbi:MAG: acyltransferase [Verrucomicrobiota bacterium]
MADQSLIRPVKKRLVWIDLAKGIGILWVVYFHFFTNYIESDKFANLPSPTSGHFMKDVLGEHGLDSFWLGCQTIGRLLWLAVSQVGFHAVGLFVLLGGWALASTTWRKADKGPIQWREWYGARFIRLYPMYWVAHLLLLLMPFTWLEPIDSRFLISLSGLRWINVENTFLYGNAAWWYFSMLIELYAIFPILFIVMRRIGLVAFLLLLVSIGFGMRYLLLIQWESSGLWILGANCLSRIPEFALGMVLGILHMRNSERIERYLLGGPAILAGLVMYLFVGPVHAGNLPYVFADFYTAIACSLVVIGISGWLEKSAFCSKWLSLVGSFSFGLYLTHQPLVTWFGQKIKSLSIPEFLLVSLGVLVVMSAFGIWLERGVNSGIERFLARSKPSE